MLSNKKPNPIMTELFIKGRKLNISLVSTVPKNIRLNYTHYFMMRIPRKENFNKLLITIYQILTLKALLIFTKNLL